MRDASALEKTFHDHVARGELAGVVALVWRPGQPTRAVAIGRRDVGRDLPVTRDTIFRIASLTKPITTVAALALLDDGRGPRSVPSCGSGSSIRWACGTRTSSCRTRSGIAGPR